MLTEGTQVLVRETNPLSDKKSDEGAGSRFVESGLGVLDNNAVNLLMAIMMSLGGIGAAAWAWGIPLSALWQQG